MTDKKDGDRHNIRENEQLGAWLADKDEEFKTAMGMRDKDRQMILSALDIVRNFIIKKGLVIYGGLGLDYCLRLKGSSIYPDDEIPDYDVYSPDPVDDAYELADILRTSGYENISAIGAKHVITMRVRINFIVVFDVSYCPPSLFKKYPYLMYNRMKVLHPDMLKAGIHKVLATPYENPPFESLYTRTKKVLTRYAKLTEKYPSTVPKESYGASLGALFEKLTVKIPKVQTQLVMYGYIAFGFVCNSLKELSKMILKDNAEFLETHPWVSDFSVEARVDGNEDVYLSFMAPLGEKKAQFLVTDISEVMKAHDDEYFTMMRPMGDLVYPTYTFGSGPIAYEFTSLPRRFVPVYVREIEAEYVPGTPSQTETSRGGAESHRNGGTGKTADKGKTKPNSKSITFTVINPQHNMMNAIAKIHLAEVISPGVPTPVKQREDAHKLLYRWVVDAVNLGNGFMSKLPDDVAKKILGLSPFSLLVQSVGDENISQSHLVCLRKLSQELGLSNWHVYQKTFLPDNYYPTNSCACKHPPKFDYNGSVFFRIDGAHVRISRKAALDILASPMGEAQDGKTDPETPSSQSAEPSTSPSAERSTKGKK